MEVVALAVHPDGDVSDAGPGVEPGPQHPERAGSADGRESPANPERRDKQTAALVEHVS